MNADPDFGRPICLCCAEKEATMEDDNCGADCSECAADLAVAHCQPIETAGIKGCNWSIHSE